MMWESYVRWLDGNPRRRAYLLPVLVLGVVALAGVMFAVFRSAWQSGPDAVLGCAIGIVVGVPVVIVIDRAARRARAARRR